MALPASNSAKDFILRDLSEDPEPGEICIVLLRTEVRD